MNKLVSLLGLQSSGPRNYPELDQYHAHCTMQIYFKDLTCQKAFNLNKDDIDSWHPDQAGNGVYELWDAETAVSNIKQLKADFPMLSDVHFWAQFPGEGLESGASRMRYIAEKVLPRLR